MHLYLKQFHPSYDPDYTKYFNDNQVPNTKEWSHISPVSPGDDKEMTLLYNSAPFPYFKQYLTEHSLGDHPEGFFQSSSMTINHQSSSPATAAITRKHTAQVLPQFL